MGRGSFLRVLKSLLCHAFTKARGLGRKHKKQLRSQNGSVGWGGSTMLGCSLDLAGGDSGLAHTSSLTHHDPLTFHLQIPVRQTCLAFCELMN